VKTCALVVKRGVRALVPAGSNQRFADRRDAGRQLVTHARGLPGGLLVLGLPRGGVVVAAEVAAGLVVELDVLVVRKVVHPDRPELALGAVTAGGTVRNETLLRRLGVPAEQFAALAAVQAEEVLRHEREFRSGRPPLALAGRAVLLVDDGLATGATARAAAQAVRAQRPSWLGLAVPVGAADVVAAVTAEVDLLVCPVVAAVFRSVSRFYAEFPQTSDDEVRAVLDASVTSQPVDAHPPRHLDGVGPGGHPPGWVISRNRPAGRRSPGRPGG